MGRKIGFYATKEDHLTLLSVAKSFGLLFVPELIHVDRKLCALAPEEFVLPVGQTFFYMIPEEVHSDSLHYEPIASDLSILKLNANKSPAIQFKPSAEKNEFLYEGRFYMRLDKEDCHYPAIFKLFKNLYSFVNNWSSTNRFGFHVGPHTSNLAQSGRIRLMHHLIELSVS